MDYTVHYCTIRYVITLSRPYKCLRSKLSLPSFWLKSFNERNGRFDGSDLFLLWCTITSVDFTCLWFQSLVVYSVASSQPVKGYLLSTVLIGCQEPSEGRDCKIVAQCHWGQSLTAKSMHVLLDDHMIQKKQPSVLISRIQESMILHLHCQSFWMSFSMPCLVEKLHHSCALHSLQ